MEFSKKIVKRRGGSKHLGNLKWIIIIFIKSMMMASKKAHIP